jgi:hypothetical protein
VDGHTGLHRGTIQISIEFSDFKELPALCSSCSNQQKKFNMWLFSTKNKIKKIPNFKEWPALARAGAGHSLKLRLQQLLSLPPKSAKHIGIFFCSVVAVIDPNFVCSDFQTQ